VAGRLRRDLPEEFTALTEMKPPRAYARGILHFSGEIRRSTLLRSPSFGGSAPAFIHGLTAVVFCEGG